MSLLDLQDLKSPQGKGGKGGGKGSDHGGGWFGGWFGGSNLSLLLC